jgi:CDP-glycerol glycerophosphotransferase (TagB/SpsB family)
VIRWLKYRQKFNRWRDLLFLFHTLRPIRGLVGAVRAIKAEIDHRFPRPTIKNMRYAVAGRTARDAYVQRGVNPDNVHITGQPRFDAILKREFHSGNLKVELGIPADRGIIVMATQSFTGVRSEELLRETIAAVINASAQFPHHQLVIKPHPQEDATCYQRIAAGMDGVIVRQKVDIYELLHACDLLITGYSTVALEAMLFNKPVITINLTGKPDIATYAGSGAALGVYRKEDLAPAIQSALFDSRTREELTQRRRAFFLENAYQPDGQASRRVAELIKQLVGECRS